MIWRSKPYPEPAPSADSPSRSASDADRKPWPWLSIRGGSGRPDVQMFHDQDGISILDFIERLGLGSGYLSDDRHLRSLNDSLGIEELLLERKESTLRPLTIRCRPLVTIEIQLQKLDLRPLLQSFRLEHFAAEYDDPSTKRFRRSRELRKRHVSINQRL